MSQEVSHSEKELEELQRIVDNMELQYNQIAKSVAPPMEVSGTYNSLTQSIVTKI